MQESLSKILPDLSGPPLSLTKKNFQKGTNSEVKMDFIWKLRKERVGEGEERDVQERTRPS